MNTSTGFNSKSTCEEYDERQQRTVNKILEVLGNPKYLHHVVQRRWDKIIVIRHEGAKTRMSFAFGTLGRGGLISVEDAIRVAKIVSDSAQPDPRAMRILTEYLEEEWATFRLTDVNREVEKYDAANPNGAYIPRCQSCGHQSNTAVCVPCRKALARTLANLDVALALFVKEEVSVFRVGTGGMSISVGEAAYRMYQSGGVLCREKVNALCERATVVPYDDNGQSAAGMMQDHLNAGARKAHAAREAARKDMMSGVQGAAVATVKGGASGGGGGYVDESEVFRGPGGEVYYSGDPKPMEKPSGFDAKTAEAIRKAAAENPGQVPSFDTGEASWSHCIDKDGNVSGDLLDTLYEFYERLREKDSTYPKIVRKDFVAKDTGMFMHIEHGPFTIDRIPWGKSTKASTLSAIEFAMDRAIEENKPERAGHLAVMLSVFQDMFAPKDDSALWGPSCG